MNTTSEVISIGDDASGNNAPTSLPGGLDATTSNGDSDARRREDGGFSIWTDRRRLGHTENCKIEHLILYVALRGVALRICKAKTSGIVKTDFLPAAGDKIWGKVINATKLVQPGRKLGCTTLLSSDTAINQVMHVIFKHIQATS